MFLNCGTLSTLLTFILGFFRAIPLVCALGLIGAVYFLLCSSLDVLASLTARRWRAAAVAA